MISYNQIKNDPYIIKIYDTIEKGIEGEELWASHSWTHVNNVASTVEKILTLLKYDKKTLELAKISALLHDIGCIEGKDNHTIRGFNMVQIYLSNKDIDDEGKSIILNAIKNHSDSENTQNIVDAVLVFADKTDYAKDRLTEAGYKIEGFNEIQYIEKIDISIENNHLIVNFIVNNQFNRKKLEDYYFTPKVFNAVHQMGNYINMNSTVQLNGEEWILNKSNN